MRAERITGAVAKMVESSVVEVVVLEVAWVVVEPERAGLP